ncbi:16S rRNA (guanine(966)-N(2))-methyltransferase RsmD [Corynebacterium atypicum]|uniref:16S rRNA (guanine(966)-N(2))-methyltransferase RsmD n=1 Tax=Corynebacterium atypicum TaxID=191610 RepID=UPI0006913A2C|nr:16S rRNA (guanine(966)-N(2))-methyltransferase RsmD [Corynebacterium atypicum]
MVRIIAGNARGRNLVSPPEGTRPTSDRAKEGLFSSLTSRFGLEGRHVLDLFSGSGALGLEALSRGAASVTLVDSEPAAVQVLRKNVAAVGMPGAIIEASDVFAFLKRAPRGYFDVVLADPPYALDPARVIEMLQLLKPALADAAMVAVERPRGGAETNWPEGYEPTSHKLKKRTYGIARIDYALFERAVPADELATEGPKK